MTPQQRMQATLERADIPAKEIRVFGSQILVTAWSEDAGRRWCDLLAKFAKVRKGSPVRSTDRNKDNRGTCLNPTVHTVWLIGASL